MSDSFEKVLEQANYTALPLPRAKSGPTTIIEFMDGHLTIVRNQHSCLPDPPLAVTEDPSVDLLMFTREFSFDLKGIVGFFAKIFGVGGAKSELEVARVRKATVQLGGLSHHTIETGALVDYVRDLKPATSCFRDILDKDHLILVAALKAKTFTYAFSDSSGAVVKFAGAEAEGLFKLDASVDVKVASDGKIVVTSPTYVGYVAWDGQRIADELEKAKVPLPLKISGVRKPVTGLEPFVNALPSTITLLEKALSPLERNRPK